MSTIVKEQGSIAPPTRRKRIAALLKLTALHRLSTLLLLLLFTAAQSPFDASSPILTTTQRILHPSSLLRWDSTHYFSQGAAHALEGARAGYAWEHNTAFQPGLPYVIRAAGWLNLAEGWNAEVAVWVSAVFCMLTSIACPAVLYLLTLAHTRDEAFSNLAANLSILAPSPATLVSPTPEAPFALATMAVALLLAPSEVPTTAGDKSTSTVGVASVFRIVLAAVIGALSTTFRANGILTLGLVLWALLWDGAARPSSASTGLLRGYQRTFTRLLLAPLAFLPLLPFLLTQHWLHSRLCIQPPLSSSSDTASKVHVDMGGGLTASWDDASNDAAMERPWEARPWCGAWWSGYGFVQERYWNVGFLRYWTPAQLPNIIMALPVLLPLLDLLQHYYRSAPWRIVERTLFPWRRFDPSPTTTPQRNTRRRVTDAASAPSALILVHHAAINAFLLLFVAHTQIALRLAIGMPLVWWGMAEWVREGQDGTGRKLSRRGKWLVAWLGGWNVISLCLYAGFYPPA